MRTPIEMAAAKALARLRLGAGFHPVMPVLLQIRSRYLRCVS